MLNGSTPDLTPYSDLAIEAREVVRPVKGVDFTEEKHELALITRITIRDHKAAAKMGKPPGHYITMESPGLREQNHEEMKGISTLLGNEISYLIQEQIRVDKETEYFVVGLGNWKATPDALGPEVVEKVMVTRHLFGETPPELREGLSSVAALSPGVLGLTGIESGEIIKGIVDQFKPDLVLAIDALAARHTRRLSTTIQLCDTGVSPGSGVGNRRFRITRDNVGVPVIAIGVPTVIHATTIVKDSLDRVKEGECGDMVAEELLSPFIGQLVVTPKGIDELIRNVSFILAGGIDQALHPAIHEENVPLYT